MLIERIMDMSSENAMPTVDPAAEVAVVSLLSDIFSDITHLDAETVHANLQLGCRGGFSEADRSIRIELGNYIMSHFALILTGLLVNRDFRETFVEAVQLESALMNESSENVAKLREQMPDSVGDRVSKGNYVVDFSKYNDMIYRRINDKVLSSFDRVIPFEEILDSSVEALSADARADISIIASNFMLLFRAFSKNGLFTDYVKDVLHTVKTDLKIK